MQALLRTIQYDSQFVIPAHFLCAQATMQWWALSFLPQKLFLSHKERDHCCPLYQKWKKYTCIYVYCIFDNFFFLEILINMFWNQMQILGCIISVINIKLNNDVDKFANKKSFSFIFYLSKCIYFRVCKDRIFNSYKQYLNISHKLTSEQHSI